MDGIVIRYAYDTGAHDRASLRPGKGEMGMGSRCWISREISRKSSLFIDT